MTLLGKLFRPWDLSSDDPSPDLVKKGSFESPELKESSASFNTGRDEAANRSPDVYTSLNHCFTFRDKQHQEFAKKGRNSNRNQRSAERFLINGDSQGCDNSKNSNSISREFDNISSNNNLSPKPSQLQDHFNHDLKMLHRNGEPPGSLFLHPAAINDLANLSRNELTALGLLPPDPPQSMKVKRQRPKRFHCPHCQVAFSNNGQLRGHIRIHTGERPFSCEHEGCGKSFTRNEELTRHRRIHSGLRPFSCTYCGKKFGRKDHLKKHTRTHQRPVYGSGSGMIGFASPFHPFNPPLMSSHSSLNEFTATHSPFALPFVPPSISHHFTFSSTL